MLFATGPVLAADPDPVAGSAVEFSAKDAWIRAAPPGARAMAGYAVFSNTSEQPLRIVSASSSAFDAVEFHESYEDGGMARMRAINQLDLPPGGEVTLQPGGLHLMLMRPTRPIAEGAMVIIDLQTEAGDLLPVALKVRSAQGSSVEHDHSQH